MSELLVPVSYGELLDKIAILQIKSERMTDPAKLANVRNELSALESTWMAHPAASGDIAERRAALKAAGGYKYPRSQTPWQEIQRGIVDDLANGMVLKPAVKYQRIHARFGVPRDNH